MHYIPFRFFRSMIISVLKLLTIKAISFVQFSKQL